MASDIYKSILANTSLGVGATFAGFKVTAVNRTDPNPLNWTLSLEKDTSLKADKASLDAIATRVAAIEAVPTATVAEVTARSTTVRRWTPNMVYAAAAATMADAKAIVEWNGTTTYNQNQIVLRNKTFFESNISNNVNKDPVTDTSGAWAPFVPGETSSVFLNRSPTNGDVYPVGVKWYDLSFGSDTPLVLLSLGNGAWAYLNQVTLTKVRFSVSGRNTSYRSTAGNFRFYKADGTALPFSSFVWGKSSGITAKGAGIAYNGAEINTSYTSGWFDLEVSGSFDPSVNLSKVTADFNTAGTYTSVGTVEFWYSNGSKKVFSGVGWSSGTATITTMDPSIVCRYGDALAAAQGEMLTAAKLSDPANNDYGRISGAALCAAQSVIFANAVTAYEARIASLETRLTDSLARLEALEAKAP